MSGSLSFRSLKTRTVQNKFYIIIGLIILILLFGLSNVWFSIKVMSGIRAYVGGEGLWSKAQKEAVNNLVKYTSSHNEADYAKYESLVRVQAGDHDARMELDKANPNYVIVRQGFVQGGNSLDDVADLSFLYRNFKHVSYMHSAIAAWVQGDVEMAKFRAVGTQIHTLIDAPTPATPAQIAPLLAQTYALDTQLTILENQFSATLGAGSRGVGAILNELTIVTTGLLGLLAIVVAVLVARAVIRLDALKSDFVSLASHQLRTPLTAINWYAEALLAESKGSLNATQRSYVTALYDGGRRMSSLIGDLLQASSLDLGTYASNETNIDVAQILQIVTHDLQPIVAKKGLSLRATIAPHLPICKADKQFLIAIFQNLLSNSVKYTPPGGTIIVDVERQRHFLMVHVGDTGIGIPKAQQEQIFTKLFRADNAKQLDSEGTGLGLYIIRTMVARMRGELWFTSVENRGSDFYIKLPVYRGKYADSKATDIK